MIKDFELALFLGIKTSRINEVFKRNSHVFNQEDQIEIPFPRGSKTGRKVPIKCYSKEAAKKLILLLTKNNFLSNPEKALEEIVLKNLKDTEQGLKLKKRQYELQSKQRIDLLFEDSKKTRFSRSANRLLRQEPSL